MKRMKSRKKTILLAVTITLVLVASVGGTIAWITTSTPGIENKFTPSTVKTGIEENFDKTVKTDITVKNTGDTAVYVRVALVGNWCNEKGEIVEKWTPSITPGSGWKDGNDGYYYYTTPLQPTKETSDLLNGGSIDTKANNGLHLEVTVLHQSIQATPVTVVRDVWGVTVDGTKISK